MRPGPASYPIRSDRAALNADDHGSSDRFHVAADWDLRRGLVVGDDDFVLVAVTQAPLAADERRLGDVLLREWRQVLLSLFDVPDDRGELGRGDRLDDRLVVDLAR